MAHLAFSDKQRIEYAAATEMLAPFGKTVADAAKHFGAYLKAIERSCTAAELVEEVLAAKKEDGMSERYVQDLRSRLPRFAEKFNGQTVATITTTQINDWLRGPPVGATTRNNFQRALVMMFNHAIAHGYATSNPAEKRAKAKVVDSPPGILSVQQTATSEPHTGLAAVCCHWRVRRIASLGDGASELE